MNRVALLLGVCISIVAEITFACGMKSAVDLDAALTGSSNQIEILFSDSRSGSCVDLDYQALAVALKFGFAVDDEEESVYAAILAEPMYSNIQKAISLALFIRSARLGYCKAPRGVIKSIAELGLLNHQVLHYWLGEAAKLNDGTSMLLADIVKARQHSASAAFIRVLNLDKLPITSSEFIPQLEERITMLLGSASTARPDDLDRAIEVPAYPKGCAPNALALINLLDVLPNTIWKSK